MKVYVASKFEDKARAITVMQSITDFRDKAGNFPHSISHDWTKEVELPPGSAPLAVERHARLCAEADYQGVVLCDIFVLLVRGDCKGAFVELGLALALNKTIIVVPDATTRCVFFHMPQVYTVATDAEVPGLVDKFAGEYGTYVKVNPR